MGFKSAFKGLKIDHAIVKNKVILGAEYFNWLKWILELRLLGSQDTLHSKKKRS
jgi:hypothetical protein